jgi:hypothetical protein
MGLSVTSGAHSEPFRAVDAWYPGENGGAQCRVMARRTMPVSRNSRPANEVRQERAVAGAEAERRGWAMANADGGGENRPGGSGTRKRDV